MNNSDSDEKGSVSILVFGLFFLMLVIVLLMTDVASIIVAQRSLVSASENAVIQAAHALDRNAYYRGNSGVNVPLDCSEARRIVVDELAAWIENDRLIHRPELSAVQLGDFICVGDEVEINTSAKFAVPFVFLGSDLREITLKAKVGAKSQTVG